MKNKILQKREDFLQKIYGGERKSYMHDFDVSNGVCNKCGTNVRQEIEKKGNIICPVIGVEEVDSGVVEY